MVAIPETERQTGVNLASSRGLDVCSQPALRVCTTAAPSLRLDSLTAPPATLLRVANAVPGPFENWSGTRGSGAGSSLLESAGVGARAGGSCCAQHHGLAEFRQDLLELFF